MTAKYNVPKHILLSPELAAILKHLAEANDMTDAAYVRKLIRVAGIQAGELTSCKLNVGITAYEH